MRQDWKRQGREAQSELEKWGYGVVDTACIVESFQLYTFGETGYYWEKFRNAQDRDVIRRVTGHYNTWKAGFLGAELTSRH
jgi:hypothetical protein